MVAGDGTFELRDNTLRASIGLKASSLSTNGLDLSAAVVNVKLTKLLRRPDRSGPASDATPFDGLQTELDAHVSGLEAAGTPSIPRTRTFSIRDGIARMGNVAVRRADNVLSASGTLSMPRDMKSWAAAPWSLDFSLNAPSMDAFNAEPNLNGPNGAIRAAGALTNGPEGMAASSPRMAPSCGCGTLPPTA